MPSVIINLKKKKKKKKKKNPALDKHGGVMIPRRAAIDSIETVQRELDLVDIWRIKNPQTSYTWSQKSPTVLC